MTLFVKLIVVAVSGVAAWSHSVAKTKLVLAVGGRSPVRRALSSACS